MLFRGFVLRGLFWRRLRGTLFPISGLLHYSFFLRRFFPGRCFPRSLFPVWLLSDCMLPCGCLPRAEGSRQSDVLGRVWQQCYVSCPLQRNTEGALVFGADPCLASRLHSAPIRNEAPQLSDLFVVNEVHLVHAEGANLPPGNVPSPPVPSAPAYRSSSIWHQSLLSVQYSTGIAF